MAAQDIVSSPVALFILVVTLAASLFLLIAAPQFLGAFMLHPYSVARGRRLHTLITSGLIHANGAHLAFNLFTFYFFAFPLERWIGSWQFAVLYLVSLVTSDLPTVIRHRDHPGYYCLGASGAIAAVLFSFIVYEPRARIAFLFLPVGIPAPLFAVIYVAISYFGMRARRGHINHEAHLWGAISGLILTALLDPGAYSGFLNALG